MNAAVERGLLDVRSRMARAAAGAGRDASGIRLVAVTKTVAAPVVEQAARLGVTDVGENRAQELVAKHDLLARSHPELRWHFVGTLQRNKAAAVAARASMIHSIDSEALGAEVGRRATLLGRTIGVFIEVNTTGEPTKHGVAPAGAHRLADAVRRLDGLRLEGLMTIGPQGDPGGTRRCFAALRALAERIGVGELSMGMSDDLEIAVEEGATVVRVGTAIFGPRSAAGRAEGEAGTK